MGFLSQALSTPNGGKDDSSSNKDAASTTNNVSKKVSGIVDSVKNKLTGRSDAPTNKTAPDGSYLGDPGTYKRGGKVKKTGMAKVHKGERVLTRKQNKKYSTRKRA